MTGILSIYYVYTCTNCTKFCKSCLRNFSLKYSFLLFFNLIVDKCSLKIPISASRNKQGCGNLVQRWVHDANTGKCEHFLFSPCDGEDVYYTSQWECRSKCIGKLGTSLIYYYW